MCLSPHTSCSPADLTLHAYTRFIHSFLGNHTVMWSDNVPLHAMRAVHINSLPAPTSRYTAGATHTSASQHTEGSSYANTASDTGSMIGGCPLNVWLDYQQVCVVEKAQELRELCLNKLTRTCFKASTITQPLACQPTLCHHVAVAAFVVLFIRHKHLGCHSRNSRSWKQHV